MHKAPQMLRVGPIHSWHSQVSPSAFGPVLEKYQLVRPQNSVRGAQAHGGGRSQSRWLSKKAHIEQLVPLVVAAMAAMVVELAQSKQSIALVVLGLNLSESCFRALQSPSSILFTCQVCPAQLRQHRQLTVRVYIYIYIYIYTYTHIHTYHTTPHHTIPYHYLSLHYIPLHCIHCITYHLHCITLHYIPYHYITLYTFIQQYRHTRPDHTKPYIVSQFQLIKVGSGWEPPWAPEKRTAAKAKRKPKRHTTSGRKRKTAGRLLSRLQNGQRRKTGNGSLKGDPGL